MDIDVKKYSEDLAHLGIENEIVEHPELVDIRDVLSYLHLDLSDCLPTLIMKADGDFIALAFRGDCRIDFKKVKKLLNVKDLRMANKEEFERLTGLPVGAARVMSPNINRIILDSKIFEKDYLLSGSGSFSSSIRYKTSDLIKIPGNIVEEIT